MPIESPELFTKLINWISIPISGMVGLLSFHYKKLNTKIESLDEEVDSLRIHTAVTQNDIKYIKESCDSIHSRLNDIEKRL